MTVFHAGTALSDARPGRKRRPRAGRHRGRRDTFANARARAYRAVDQIDFADGFHRRDIGWRELARSERMNALWDYFWPIMSPDWSRGLIAGIIGFRHRRKEEAACACVGACCRDCALAALVARAVGRGRPAREPRRARHRATTLDHYEMTQVNGACPSRPAHAPSCCFPARPTTSSAASWSGS